MLTAELMHHTKVYDSYAKMAQIQLPFWLAFFVRWHVDRIIENAYLFASLKTANDVWITWFFSSFRKTREIEMELQSRMNQDKI